MFNCLTASLLFVSFVIEPGFESAMYCPPPADSGEKLTYTDTGIDLAVVNHLMFLFKGCDNCMMVFTDGPHTDGIGYEMVNGGWKNTQSTLR